MTKKTVAILGGGIAGIYVAYRLAQAGFKVVIFEKEDRLGGLAATFKVGSSRLEKFYHHFFQTDEVAIRLIKELNLADDFYFSKLSTAIYYQNQIYPFNRPQDLLQFKPLPIADRLRTGAVLFFLKKNKRWQKLATITADHWLNKWLGSKAYSILWQPLLKSKFGAYWPTVNMAWFWSRIHCRSSQLGYFKGGYQTFFNRLIGKITDLGVEVRLESNILSVQKNAKDENIIVKTAKTIESFDLVLSTLPESIAAKVFVDLPADFIKKRAAHHHLGAQTLILLLDRRLLDHYWLNINDPDPPFLVAIDQSYIADVGSYDNLYPVYFGNYLNYDDRRWQMNQDDLLNLYLPFIKKLNPRFSKDWIRQQFLFKMPAAQYVIDTNYGQTIMPIKLPIKNCYSAAMSQVYPQDRGINYALVLVDRVIKQLKNDL